MNATIFGLVSGVCIAAAGSSITEQPVKTILLIVVLNIVAHFTFSGRKP